MKLERLLSVFLAGIVGGIVLSWACGNPNPPAHAQTTACDKFTVSFVESKAHTDSSTLSTIFDDTPLAAGQEPFGAVSVPGTLPPFIAVRTCQP